MAAKRDSVGYGARGDFGYGRQALRDTLERPDPDTDRKCFLLDIDLERMEEAEGFDKDNWPRMADTAWATQVHEYYGQRPYW